VNWAFSFQSSIENIVEEKFPEETHRWPLLRTFNFDAHSHRDRHLILVMRDKLSGTPAGPSLAQPIEAPELPSDLSVDNIDAWLNLLITKFQVRPRDLVAVLPIHPEAGARTEEQWEAFNDDEQRLWQYQVDFNITRQLYFLKGLDMSGGFFIPPGYRFLADECAVFLKDHPTYETNVFIMTRLQRGNRLLEELDKELRKAIRAHGLNPVRADDRMYMADRNVWNNVCVYMICCKLGVAILEDRVQDEFNPNVALEYGFMRALNKPCLLLADTSFRNLRADILGTLRETFDITNIHESISEPIERWLKDLGLPPK
jgi:hypothetical protein